MNQLITSRYINETSSIFNSILSGDVIITEENHSFAFLCACQGGYLETVKLLMSIRGFDSVNTSNYTGDTPILCACAEGHLEIVKLLISTDGFNSLNVPNLNNETAFLGACIGGHLEIVKLLIATPGFNSLNIPDNYGKTPFFWACQNGYLEIVKLLIKTPGFNSLNIPNNVKITPIIMACTNKHLEIVKLLIITPGFNSLNNVVNKNNKTLFTTACCYKCLDIITILLLQDNLIRPNDEPRSLGRSLQDEPRVLGRSLQDEPRSLGRSFQDEPRSLGRSLQDEPRALGISRWEEKHFSNEVKKRIKSVETNRTYYMKKYKTSLVIDLYRLVVFLSDGYLQIKSSKFFKIIKELPTELQIKIIFASVKWNQTYILAEDFNDGLKEFVTKHIDL
jgi:hypothetical protein